MISIGMLYRTCGGSLSPRLRWKTTAHRIRPQTTAPTARPAIHDPCQSVTTVLPCSVTGLGKPTRVNVSFVQPVRLRTPAASTATRTAVRFGLLLLGTRRVHPWSVVKARAFLGSATACRANSIARLGLVHRDPPLFW